MPPVHVGVVVLFCAVVGAFIALFVGLCYGVILGIAALAHEPRGVQIAIALGIAAGAFLVSLWVIAGGRR
jgi:hypothetical protein